MRLKIIFGKQDILSGDSSQDSVLQRFYYYYYYFINTVWSLLVYEGFYDQLPLPKIPKIAMDQNHSSCYSYHTHFTSGDYLTSATAGFCYPHED